LIQDKVKNFFVDEVLFGKLVSGGTVEADAGDDGVDLRIIQSGL
jgi:hypothetical protein